MRSVKICGPLSLSLPVGGLLMDISSVRYGTILPLYKGFSSLRGPKTVNFDYYVEILSYQKMNGAEEGT